MLYTWAREGSSDSRLSHPNSYLRQQLPLRWVCQVPPKFPPCLWPSFPFFFPTAFCSTYLLTIPSSFPSFFILLSFLSSIFIPPFTLPYFPPSLLLSFLLPFLSFGSRHTDSFHLSLFLVLLFSIFLRFSLVRNGFFSF